MKQKKYSVEEKKKYHESRSRNSFISDSKRLYSRSWLLGYDNAFPNYNYNAVRQEYLTKKNNKQLSLYNRVELSGFMNGAKSNPKFKHN